MLTLPVSVESHKITFLKLILWTKLWDLFDAQFPMERLSLPHGTSSASSQGAIAA